MKASVTVGSGLCVGAMARARVGLVLVLVFELGSLLWFELGFELGLVLGLQLGLVLGLGLSLLGVTSCRMSHFQQKLWKWK